MVGEWLLCDFHIHTKFSDGHLSLSEIIDLYGSNGFDVINISDHLLDDQWIEKCAREGSDHRSLLKKDFQKYLDTIYLEVRRAWEEYNMIVIPGIEISNNTNDFHIVTIDIKDFIDANQSVEDICDAIHAQNGLAIAAHPFRGALEGTGEFMHLWNNHEKFMPYFDAWEVANRDDLFQVVGLKKINYIANSDFHKPKHLYSWKTLLNCEKNVEAIKEAIRKNIGVSIYLFRKGKNFKI